MAILIIIWHILECQTDVNYRTSRRGERGLLINTDAMPINSDAFHNINVWKTFVREVTKSMHCIIPHFFADFSASLDRPKRSNSEGMFLQTPFLKLTRSFQMTWNYIRRVVCNRIRISAIWWAQNTPIAVFFVLRTFSFPKVQQTFSKTTSIESYWI